MAEMLLINPRRRRKAHAAPKRRVSVKRRRNPLTVVAAAPARRRRRVAPRMHAVAHARRRRNPLRAMHTARKRRRNPISLMGGVTSKGIMSLFKEAAIGGAGAVAVDVLMGQVNTYLPTSLQPTPGATTVGVNDAVKAGVTVLLGHVLRKPTKGLSTKMALGALTVQAAGIMKSFVPASMTMGFYSPANIVQGTNRVGPIRHGVNAYIPAGNTPLLNAYMAPGRSALLSGMGTSAQRRELVSPYR